MLRARASAGSTKIELLVSGTAIAEQRSLRVCRDLARQGGAVAAAGDDRNVAGGLLGGAGDFADLARGQ